MSADLLIEIGTEELPPKALQKLSDAFTCGVVDGLNKAGFEVGAVQSFATPRRLAMLVKDVPASQPDREVERKGPSLKAAYDDNGKPSKAVEGFARSCGVTVDQLETVGDLSAGVAYILAVARLDDFGEVVSGSPSPELSG